MHVCTNRHVKIKRKVLKLTLMALLLDGTGLEVENATSMLWLSCAQLLPDLVRVVRMDLVVETGSIPIALGVVEDRCYRVRDVDDATGVAAHDEQETVSSFQDQVLQFLVRQEGRLVRAVCACVAGACVKKKKVLKFLNIYKNYSIVCLDLLSSYGCVSQFI